MSLLGSILGGLFGGWTWPWSKKTDTYSSITTKSGIEEVLGTDDNDRVTINGTVKALDSGTNTIFMGDGQDTLNINGRVESSGGGVNEIDLGEGGSSLRITGAMKAVDSSSNTINAGADNDCVTIVGRVSATDASTDINLGDGDNSLSISLGLAAISDSVNYISAGDGDDAITITGGVYSEGLNEINAGDGDNYVTIMGGMVADGGANSIITGDGDDTISIWGATKAVDGGQSFIETGAGDDVISLHNNVEADSLVIDAGYGDDTLVLNASRAALFNNAYEDWLTEYADQYGLETMNVDTFEVTMSRVWGNLSELEWLKDLTDEAGIQLQLNVNCNGRNLNLASFFDTDTADVFDTLSMEGGIRNTLTIKGTLDTNGYDGNELTILGDSNDTVRLSKADWTEVGSDNVAAYSVADASFNYYSNDEGQMLLIQQDISVLFM